MRGSRFAIEGPTLAAGGFLRRGRVVVKGSLIERVEEVEEPRYPQEPGENHFVFADGLILPGFIDVHLHGGGGGEVMDATPEALATVARCHARHGTTGFLATTLSASREQTARALEEVARAAAKGIPGGARVLGAHLEGPYLNPARAGAHRKEFLRNPSLPEVASWWDISPGAIKLASLAPELPGAEEVSRWLVERGVVVAVAHSIASFRQVAEAAGWGLSHATHLFNAMAAFHHREPGPVGAALTLPGFTVELIADGVHLHLATLGMAIRAAGAERVLLVTDAMRAAGLGDGRYDLAGLEVTVREGTARLVDGRLAGSVLTMDRALSRLVRGVGVALEEAVNMVSRNPARLLGIERRKGSIGEGKDADLVVVDRNFEVLMTVVEGSIVYRREEGEGGR